MQSLLAKQAEQPKFQNDMAMAHDARRTGCVILDRGRSGKRLLLFSSLGARWDVFRTLLRKPVGAE